MQPETQRALIARTARHLDEGSTAMADAVFRNPVSAYTSPERLARERNDANAIALGARLTGIDMAKACVETFLSTPFAGDRHLRRVEKLTNPPQD